jgi:hypothetical protein
MELPWGFFGRFISLAWTLPWGFFWEIHFIGMDVAVGIFLGDSFHWHGDFLGDSFHWHGGCHGDFFCRIIITLLAFPHRVQVGKVLIIMHGCHGNGEKC